MKLFKLLSRTWMVYMIIREVLCEVPGRALVRLTEPKYPLRCYFAGGFVLEESISKATGLLYAVILIGWSLMLRSAIGVRAPATLYFILLERGDIERFIREFRLGAARFRQEQFLSQIMCYRIKQYNKPSQWALRATRTPEVHDKIKRVASRYYVTAIAILSFLEILITTLISYVTLPNWRYLRAHPGCSPEFELLHASKPADIRKHFRLGRNRPYDDVQFRNFNYNQL